MKKEVKGTYGFKPFEELEFSDDFMFGKIMRNEEICAGVIERLLKIKVDRIEYPELQKEIAPYYTSRGVRLDVYVKDSDRVFDIEMQSSRSDALEKRMRYYQSMIDIDSLMKGADYSELKERFVIFICKEPPFVNSNLPVYSFSNMCFEAPGLELGDKTHKLVYNASAYGQETDGELKAFLRFVCSGSAGDSFSEKISALIEQAKLAEAAKTEYMTMNLHERDIRYAAKREQAVETAEKMIRKGLSLEQISELTALPYDEIAKLKSELKEALEEQAGAKA